MVSLTSLESPEKPLTEKYAMNLGATPITYQVKVSKRARRLRVTISQQDVSVTLPQGVHVREAEKFLRANAQWVLAQLERSKKQTPRTVLPADVILLHGVPTRVERIEEAGRKARTQEEARGAVAARLHSRTRLTQ